MASPAHVLLALGAFFVALWIPVVLWFLSGKTRSTRRDIGKGGR
jgi:hypothetical protein